MLRLARDLDIPVVETIVPREMLYIADEVFFTGTAAEITPIRSIDRIPVGKGHRGPITEKLQKEFFARDRRHWRPTGMDGCRRYTRDSQWALTSKVAARTPRKATSPEICFPGCAAADGLFLCSLCTPAIARANFSFATLFNRFMELQNLAVASFALWLSCV